MSSEMECEDYSDSLSSLDLETNLQTPTTVQWDPVSVPSPPSKDNIDEIVRDLLCDDDDDVFVPVKVSKNIKSVLHQKAQQVRTQRKEDVDIITTSPICNTPTVSDVSSISEHSQLYTYDYDNDDDADRYHGIYKIFKFPQRIKRTFKKCKCTCGYSVDPNGSVYLWWLAFMFLIYSYNLMSISLRSSFPFVQGTNFTSIGSLKGPPEISNLGLLLMWMVLDVIMDAMYVVDIVFISSHLVAASESIEAKDVKINVKDLWHHYVSKWHFWVDVLSLLPLEILYIVPLLRFNVLLRLPRLIRIHRVYMFYDLFESSIKYPHAFRLAKMAGYLLLTVHIYACIYYVVSAREGFGTNSWVYDGQGISYIRCFYWALMSVATIHDLNERSPGNNLEFALGAFGHLVGVFIFAIVISEIKNIVEAANLQKLLYRQKQDQMKQFMQSHKIPPEIQKKVKDWSDYTFTHQRMLHEDKALESLPKKMRSDIAMNVHFSTLSKVKIFKGFERNLLRELVLKLHPLLVMPKEYICKKDEIGREMYIVNKGVVQVFGGQPRQLLVELGPGSVFGEISLLATGRGNRRTADVVSKGYSNLFVLSKKDLNETLVDYPFAKEKLKKKANFLLQQDKRRSKTSLRQ
ncbi:PREDICTED: cyclic nucleotide-gated cation channel beta-1-like [Amphimedon queenslandica]|uniref:Cyclic nucleotide-binding domain-containing protein n=1 Tax=Amphimedon queenslandica TaxID=400682 RepID=A0A1X7VIZ6_AMPQE|nr:PREDICTED: cyclic nucleotide-gated cation channel beta-1-like [Amphimedon queenslandica]|eukprot:XP_011410082.2 PREDICTED: cyclic nucleotide-gated cation channel beta-1-like [Amphimedon queenslandica]